MGTQKNGLDETVFLSTQNMFKLMGKKIITILRLKILLYWPNRLKKNFYYIDEDKTFFSMYLCLPRAATHYHTRAWQTYIHRKECYIVIVIYLPFQHEHLQNTVPNNFVQLYAEISTVASQSIQQNKSIFCNRKMKNVNNL